MKFKNIIYSFNFLEVLFEFVKIWFKHFNTHIVNVVLTKLEHSVSQTKSLF